MSAIPCERANEATHYRVMQPFCHYSIIGCCQLVIYPVPLGVCLTSVLVFTFVLFGRTLALVDYSVQVGLNDRDLVVLGAPPRLNVRTSSQASQPLTVLG